jgi:hypothetical protein
MFSPCLSLVCVSLHDKQYSSGARGLGSFLVVVGLGSGSWPCLACTAGILCDTLFSSGCKNVTHQGSICLEPMQDTGKQCPYGS